MASPLPVDLKEQAETAQVLEQIGVSQETILTDLGYDAKTEREKKAGEAVPAPSAAV